ncbi:hypothetical protein LXL04_003406 [Taraxacum kok-saghyz]
MKTPPLAVNRYILTFIDEFSRKLWFYFLKEKLEAFSSFKIFKELVERQNGGGEFTSVHFLDFLNENRIQHKMTAKYTRQQNGVAEIENRTHIEEARSMLKAKNLNNCYWGSLLLVHVT